MTDRAAICIAKRYLLLINQRKVGNYACAGKSRAGSCSTSPHYVHCGMGAGASEQKSKHLWHLLEIWGITGGPGTYHIFIQRIPMTDNLWRVKNAAMRQLHKLTSAKWHLLQPQQPAHVKTPQGNEFPIVSQHKSKSVCYHYSQTVRLLYTQ